MKRRLICNILQQQRESESGKDFSRGAKGGFCGSIQPVLKIRFGKDGLDIYPKIRRIQKAERLKKNFESAEDVLKAVQKKK